MNGNEINELIRRVTVADVAMSSILLFLKKHNLEEEAKKFTKNYLASVKNEDWQELITNQMKSLKEIK